MTEARARDFNRWVQLTLRPAGKDLLVEYADEHGPRTSAAPMVEVFTEAAWRGLDGADTEGAGPGGADPAAMREASARFPRLLVPAELPAWLREGFADRYEGRMHIEPDGSWDDALRVSWLLPVFVVAPSVLSRLPWEKWLEALLFAEPDLSTRCVLIRAQAVPPPPPLRLPLMVGDIASQDGELLAGVRSRPWWAENRDVQKYGLRLLKRKETLHAGADLVIRMLGQRLPLQLQDKGKRRPKLIVSIVTGDTLRFTRKEMALEHGVSHLLLMHRHPWPAQGREGVVAQIVYALVHDFALHEIDWIIRESMPDVDTMLVTSVAANQSLRLSTVMRNMADEARARRPDLREPVRRLAFDFTRETRGLTAMAAFRARAEVGPAPEISAEHLPAPRRVDMSVDYYNAFGVLTPMDEYERRWPLRCGWPFRLRVHIGSPEHWTSAMVGNIPAFDSLLPEAPDDRPRPIEVAVFAKTFRLESAPVQTILLPRAGGTSPVYFELRAPQAPGPADLRVVLYSEGNLVQSFVLEAEIAHDTTKIAAHPLAVRLASGGAGELEAVERLRPRALSIALNDDAAPGSHTVMVKGRDWRHEVHLDNADMTAQMDRFCKFLKEAGGEPAVSFETSIRKFAALGGRIWNMLTSGKQDTAGVFADLRSSAGQTLQFVRHGSGRPFPWQTVYDYAVPQGDRFVNAPICLADRPSQGPLQPGQKGCPHRPGEDVVCIEGFWNARHRIELLSEDAYALIPDKKRATHATAPLPNPLVLLGLGADSLVSDDFIRHLEEMLPNGLSKIKASDAPVAELLWNEDRRPALLILLAHLLEGNEDLNLPLRMHAFHPGADGADISIPILAQQRLKGHWTEPRQPLVLLLACQSARRDIGELTSLLDAFLVSGAAGAIGTEWDVQASTAAEFATHIIQHTLAASPKVPLGETMRRFVHDSLRAGSIWPFVFTVYGNADMTVGRPEP